MDLVEHVYQVTRELPREEQFCLSMQLRRSAISVPSNIAEGQGRRAPREFSHFLQIAHGSLRELETQILIARRLGYINEVSMQSVMDRAAGVGRLITGLRNSLREKSD